MADYVTTQDLLRDLLFRTGEPTDGSSEYSLPPAALRYLNRAYNLLQMGGGELDPTISINWYWLRAAVPGTLRLLPEVATTVDVVADNPAITFPALADASRSLLKDFLVVKGEPTVYRITAHTAGATTATLVDGYIGATGAAKACRFVRTTYDLGADVLRLMAPMRSFTAAPSAITRGFQTYEIEGIGLQRMEELYPLALIQPGVPQYFAFLRESITGLEKVRFNTSGNASGGLPILIEYEYMLRPDPLINTEGEQCHVPLEHRKLLSDIAAWLIFTDKNDVRALVAKEIAMQGLRALAKDHRDREGQFTRQIGRIYPRQQRLRRRYVVAGY